SLASTKGPSVTLSLPLAIAIRAPSRSGISPPLSIIRPALISRSVILPMASINAGVGACIGCGEVTMYMKRMKNSCFGELQAVSRIPSRYWIRRSDGSRIDTRASGELCRLKGFAALHVHAVADHGPQLAGTFPARHVVEMELHELLRHGERLGL